MSSSRECIRKVYSRHIFSGHERENDIVNSIAPALVNAIAYAPSLSDDDEEERESDIALTETAKCAIAKLEHFVYAKPELGQYQIADFEEEEKKRATAEKSLNAYSRNTRACTPRRTTKM